MPVTLGAGQGTGWHCLKDSRLYRPQCPGEARHLASTTGYCRICTLPVTSSDHGPSLGGWWPLLSLNCLEVCTPRCLRYMAAYRTTGPEVPRAEGTGQQLGEREAWEGTRHRRTVASLNTAYCDVICVVCLFMGEGVGRMNAHVAGWPWSSWA